MQKNMTKTEKFIPLKKIGSNLLCRFGSGWKFKQLSILTDSYLGGALKWIRNGFKMAPS